MSKKIQAHFEKEHQRIVIDSENVNIGDYIDIASFSLLEEFIDSKLDEKYKNGIITTFKQSKEYTKLVSDKEEFERQIKSFETQKEKIAKDAVTEFKASSKYKELENELILTKERLTNFINSNKNEKNNIINEFMNSDEYKKLVNSKIELENQLKQEQNKLKFLQDNFENQKQQIKLQAIADFKANNEEYLKLKEDNTTYITELKNSYYKHVDEFKKTDDYINLTKELEQLKKEKEMRRNANSKVIGEELENWCKSEADNSFQLIDDVLFTKTTKSIGGKKPDFLFNVYKDNSKNVRDLIGTVVLEMKTDNGENKTKNETHYKTLEENRKNFGAEFGILVTELELNSDEKLTIRKVPNYENLFVVRPSFFINILILFRLIYKKCEILKDKLNAENVTAEYVNQVIEKFNEFKIDIIASTIKKIKSNLDEINKNAENIKNSADKILNSANIIFNTHITTFENKLEKIVKELTSGEKKYNKLCEEIEKY